MFTEPHHFVNFLNQWKSMSFCEQILGENLSRLAGVKIDFPM